MSRTVKITYTGSMKVNAVRAVRKVCNVGLKEATDAVEADYFVVTPLQHLAIIGAFVSFPAPASACPWPASAANPNYWVEYTPTPVDEIDFSDNEMPGESSVGF